MLPEGVEAVTGDVTDPDSLQAALDGIGTVYHAAGIPEQWRKDTEEFARVNVEGTRNVVEAALAAGVERFVYTSTDDALVQGPGKEFDESVLNPGPGRHAVPALEARGRQGRHCRPWIAACPPSSCTPRACTARRRFS